MYTSGCARLQTTDTHVYVTWFAERQAPYIPNDSNSSGKFPTPNFLFTVSNSPYRLLPTLPPFSPPPTVSFYLLPSFSFSPPPPSALFLPSSYLFFLFQTFNSSSPHRGRRPVNNTSRANRSTPIYYTDGPDSSGLDSNRLGSNVYYDTQR